MNTRSETPPIASAPELYNALKPNAADDEEAARILEAISGIRDRDVQLLLRVLSDAGRRKGARNDSKGD